MSKYYVVWKGVKPWVYDNRSDCKNQVDGFLNAQYKSFPDAETASFAFANNLIWHKWKYELSHLRQLMGESFNYSICTDAACPSNPGPIEYRGVILSTGEEIFRYGPYPWWSVNIAEFLAIVEGIKWLMGDRERLMKSSKWTIIYSDSKIALSRVERWEINTSILHDNHNRELFQIIDQSINRLQMNNQRKGGISLIKRPTEKRWQIPADFGRK
jgi:ribonuclease HI